jgi:hypothetical protein
MSSRIRSSAALCAVSLLSSACFAKMVSTPGSTAHPSRYAPVNEASRGGVIKYLNGDVSIFRRKRRENAYKQMSNACGGAYRIDAEGPRSEGGFVISSGDAADFSESEYWYIQFSCVREDPSADTT